MMFTCRVLLLVFYLLKYVELDDLRWFNELDCHIEHKELFEESI